MQQFTNEAPGPERSGAMEELARDPASRKRFLRMLGGGAAASAFAVVLSACGGDGDGGDRGGGAPATGRDQQRDEAQPGGAAGTREPSPDPRKGTSDEEILSYALKLEYLDTAFYADVVEADLFRGPQLDMIKRFRENERAHLVAVTEMLEKVGGTPIERPKTRFPLGEPGKALRLAAALENAGAAAYLGQANRIRSKEVLAAALSIHTVEARHAAALNGLLGRPAAPTGSFAQPLSMEEVLTNTQRFIVSA
jgi:rubrerythrin